MEILSVDKAENLPLIIRRDFDYNHGRTSRCFLKRCQELAIGWTVFAPIERRLMEAIHRWGRR